MDTPLVATVHASEHHAGPHVWGSRFWTVLHTLSFTAASRPTVVLLFLWQVLPELLPCGTCRLHHILNMIQGGLHALAKVTTMSRLPVDSPERRFALIRHVCRMRAEVGRRNMLCEARVRERMSSFFKQATGLDIGGGAATTHAWFADFTRKKDLIIASGSRIPFSVYGRDLWFMLHIAAFVLPQDEGSLAHHHERGSAPPLPDYAGNRFRERMFAWFVQHVPAMLPPEHGGMAVRVLSLNLLHAQRDTGSSNLAAVQRHLSAAVEARLRRGESGAGCRTSSITTLFRVHQLLRHEYRFCGACTGGAAGSTNQQQRLYALRSQGIIPSEAPVTLYAHAARKGSAAAASTVVLARAFLWHRRMLKGRRMLGSIISDHSITNIAQPLSPPYAGDPSIQMLARITPAFRYRRWTVLEHVEEYREAVFISALNRTRLFVPRMVTTSRGFSTLLVERMRLCRTLLLDSLLSLTGSIRTIMLSPVAVMGAVADSGSRNILTPLPPQWRHLLSRQIRRGIRLHYRDFTRREQRERRVHIGSKTKHKTFSSSLTCWGVCMMHRLRVLKGLLEAPVGPLYNERSQNGLTPAFDYFLTSKGITPSPIDHGFHRWITAVAGGFSITSISESEVESRRHLNLLHATAKDLTEVTKAWCTSDDAVFVRSELEDGGMFDVLWCGPDGRRRRRRRVAEASSRGSVRPVSAGTVHPNWFEALPLHHRLRRVVERAGNCYLPVSGCCAGVGVDFGSGVGGPGGSTGKCSLPPSSRLHFDALASDEVWQRVPSSSGSQEAISDTTTPSTKERQTHTPAAPSILRISPLCESHEHLRIFPLFASVCLEVAEDAFAAISNTRTLCLSLVHSILRQGPFPRSACGQWREPPPLTLPAADTLVDSLTMARRVQEEMLVIVAAVSLSAAALFGFCLLRSRESGFMLRFRSSREMRNFGRLSASAGGDGQGRHRLYMGFVFQSIWVRAVRNLRHMLPGATERVVPPASVAAGGRGGSGSGNKGPASLDDVAGGDGAEEEVAERRRVSGYVLRLVPDRPGGRALTRTVYRLLFIDPHFSGNLTFDPDKPTKAGPANGGGAGVLVWIHQDVDHPVQKITDYSRIRVYGDPLHGAIGRVLQREGITPDLATLARELRHSRSVPFSMVLGWAIEAARRSVLREVAPFYLAAANDSNPPTRNSHNADKKVEKGIREKDSKADPKKKEEKKGSLDRIGGEEKEDQGGEGGKSKDEKGTEDITELLNGLSSPFLLPQSTPAGRKVRGIGFGNTDVNLNPRETSELRHGILQNIDVFHIQAALIDNPSSFLTDWVLIQDERNPDYFLPAHERLTGEGIWRGLNRMYTTRFEISERGADGSLSRAKGPVGQFFLDSNRLKDSILRWYKTTGQEKDELHRLLGPFFDHRYRRLRGFPIHCREELLSFLS